MSTYKFTSICLSALLIACTNFSKLEKKPVKNVILLISDGAGLSQISSIFFDKKITPNYARFKNIGLIKTSSSRQDVTDSAAGATAFACGVKTYNGAIGVADDSTRVKNLVEISSEKRVKTGVIATSSITHATPACFYAHTFNRSSEEIIAKQLTHSEIDFFAGGGLQFFNNRTDGKNLVKTLENNNFTMDTVVIQNFSKIVSSEKVGYLLSKNGMPTVEKGRRDFLSKATEQAIQFLSKDDESFFLMVEGSQIDWGGHSNNPSYVISELVDFDIAVGKALDFAKKDANTLVIVTSDHETGGFTLASKTKTDENGKPYSDYSEIEIVFSTGGHSATLIPVFAYGLGAEEFVGIYENNVIFDKIMKVTQWGL